MVSTIRTTARSTIKTSKRERDPRTGYSDRTWRRYALAWVSRYPLCVLCLCRGVVNYGAGEYATTTQRNLIVDHITPHRGDSELFWRDTNHETLCRYPCHDSDKSRHEHRGKSASQWFDWLVELIVEHGSWSHVEACSEWVPRHVMEQLNVRMTAKMADQPGRGGGQA